MESMGGEMNRTRRMVLTAMLFAAAMVLSIIEGGIPIPVPVPGVKFGLSNIVVMYALFFVDIQSAVSVAVLKGVFTILTKGPIAGILSLTGGLLSVGVMFVLMAVIKEKGSYFLYSMCGALFHNIGQFAAISLIYSNQGLWYYLPVLLITGVLAGGLTSVLLKIILPALKKLGLK